MNDLITVIVPVYNVERYLQKCVDSILKQTYENMEIILVDDGSTDSCGDICDSYAKKDNRINVIHKKNGGLSDARNAGIEILKGKYVTFIDGDDWVEPTYVERLYKLLVENDADVSVCDFYYIDANGRLFNSPSTDGRIYVWNREDTLSMLLTVNRMSTSVCGKMYNSRFFVVNGFRFPVGRLYEDIPITYAVVLAADKIVFGDYALYNYFIRPQSISNMSFSPRKMHAIEHVEAVVPQILQQFPQLDAQCAIALFCVNFNLYIALDGARENAEYEKKVIWAVKHYRNTVIFSRHSSMKWRIKAMMTYMGLPLTRKIFAQRIVKGKK